MKTNSPAQFASALADTNDIRGIKPPVEVSSEWAWLWWALAILLLVALALAAWIWWRKKAATSALVPVVPPHVRAKQRLTEAFAFISNPDKFCTLVSNTIRVYLEERFHLRAPERTTEEFLLELQISRHLTPDQKQSLGHFLESCDLVKFARFEPTESALRELHDSALRLIDETQYEPVSASPPSGPPLPPPPLPPDLQPKPDPHSMVNR